MIHKEARYINGTIIFSFSAMKWGPAPNTAQVGHSLPRGREVGQQLKMGLLVDGKERREQGKKGGYGTSTEGKEKILGKTNEMPACASVAGHLLVYIYKL